MKLIMENWRKFLLTELSSSGTVSKLIKLENDAKILVKNAIKDLESEHNTVITATHLRRSMPGFWGIDSRSVADAADKAMMLAYKSDVLLRGIINKREFIHKKLARQYDNAISTMLKQKPSEYDVVSGRFDAMIIVLFAIEKGLKPSNVYGDKFAIQSTMDPFAELEAKNVKKAKDSAAELKGNIVVYTLVRAFLPDGWDKASENAVRICCHLLREKFGSSGITLMGPNIKTPSYLFIMDFISGRMTAHIEGALDAATDSPMDSLNYLKFHDGDDMLQSVVDWINQNTTPTLKQVIAKIDEVIKHMTVKGFGNHGMCKQAIASRTMILLVLGQ